MPILDRLAARTLALMGLDFELSIDWENERFSRVADKLFVGVRPIPDDLGALHEAGITEVVSCLPSKKRDAMRFLEPHMRAHFFELRDSVHQEISPQFAPFFELLHEARQRNGRLLVHCEAGVSRSATLAIAAVMQDQGLSFYEAFISVHRARPVVLPNIGFASQLSRLERSAGHPCSLGRYLIEVCKVPVEPEVLQGALEAHDFDAFLAIRSIFGGEVPRVVQGVRI